MVQVLLALPYGSVIPNYISGSDSCQASGSCTTLQGCALSPSVWLAGGGPAGRGLKLSVGNYCAEW